MITTVSKLTTQKAPRLAARSKSGCILAHPAQWQFEHYVTPITLHPNPASEARQVSTSKAYAGRGRQIGAGRRRRSYMIKYALHLRGSHLAPRQL
eukprot:5971619-Pleurochrysis_carterae.AAC.2